MSFFFNGPSPWCALVAAASVLLVSPSLQADPPKMGMANLFVDDRGSEIVLNWHFYYLQMPKQFLLHEMQDEPISLPGANAQLLEKDLTDIAKVAFALNIDGRNRQPTWLKYIPYPDKSCLLELGYPGHPRGKVDLSAPILQYLPPSFVFEVDISSSTGKRGAIFGKNLPPVLHFVQGQRTVPVTTTTPFFSKAFVTELGTAWVNYNWILLCVVLLLMRRPKQIVALVASLVICWIVLCFVSVVFNDRIPGKIPELVLALPTVLLCVIFNRYRGRLALFSLVTIVAGLLNACYDLQQIPASNPAQTVSALTGLSLGFVGGILLVLLVLIPLWWECRKYPGFEESWAPQISWAVAFLAVFLPLQKWLFG